MSSHNYNFDLQIPKYQKIGSCRFKNGILLYLASVANEFVIYQEEMLFLSCAIFLLKLSQGLEVSENRTSKIFYFTHWY